MLILIVKWDAPEKLRGTSFPIFPHLSLPCPLHPVGWATCYCHQALAYVAVFPDALKHRYYNLRLCKLEYLWLERHTSPQTKPAMCWRGVSMWQYCIVLNYYTGTPLSPEDYFPGSPVKVEHRIQDVQHKETNKQTNKNKNLLGGWINIVFVLVMFSARPFSDIQEVILDIAEFNL